MRRALCALLTAAAIAVAYRILRIVRSTEMHRRICSRVSQRHPDPNVSPARLVDRIRSTIGPLERTLDVPHVHVMVDGQDALLHGDVGCAGDVIALERAVRRVSGVRRVESHLHIGLLRSDTRPSRGRNDRPRPSAARTRLLAAARRGGAEDVDAPSAVRATLEVLFGRLPPGEREHVLGHLPADVRKLVFPPTYSANMCSDLRTITDFVAAVIAEEPGRGGPAEAIVTEILAELRRLVPEEVGDVAAVLPHELRSLWVACPERERPRR